MRSIGASLTRVGGTYSGTDKFGRQVSRLRLQLTFLGRRVNRDCCIVAKVELRASDVIEGAVEGFKAGSGDHDECQDKEG
jgi:hypothetical protein